MIKEMREPTFLVLTTLAEGKRHGYAIIQGVASLSDGDVALKAGTLYAMLDRLTFDGVIALAGEEVVDGRLRRYYELLRPCAPHRYLHARGGHPLALFPCVRPRRSCSARDRVPSLPRRSSAGEAR